jgi:hypothetical protein
MSADDNHGLVLLADELFTRKLVELAGLPEAKAHQVLEVLIADARGDPEAMRLLGEQRVADLLSERAALLAYDTIRPDEP